MTGDRNSEARENADEYATAANSGDRDAVGAYLQQNLPYLASIARWLARDAAGLVDPDDLVAETIANLLVLWSQGRGPRSNPNAYLIRAMRNRIIDAYRSPRSRHQPLVDSDTDLPPEYLITRDIDLHREYGYVRQALALLPEDQQHVLRATIIDGRKPAELEAELDRPAAAIHALAHRARAALRRATLRVVLSEGAPAECTRAAGRLPQKITMDVEDAPDSSGMGHIRTCERCRGAWARYSGMATLGVVSVLVAGNVLGGGVAAEASEAPRADIEARPAPKPRPKIQGRYFVAIGASIALIVAGVVIFIVTSPSMFAGLPSAPSAPTAEPSATAASPAPQLQVTSQATGTGRATLDVHARIGGDLSVSLELPPGVSVASFPVGWECSGATTDIICALRDDKDGTFELLDARTDQRGVYRLELTGEQDGRQISGFAQGSIADGEQTVRVDRIDGGAS